MQIALLVDLVLHANEVVPADRPIDDLWGEANSDNAATGLRVSVLRLRRVLPPGAITTRAPGYLINLGPEQLDLFQFERLVEEARRDLDQGSPQKASDGIRQALALWLGPALAHVAYQPFARAALARLDETRIEAVEIRVEAELSLGRHGELIGELEGLVVEQPMRERLRGHLMVALYRSDRQVDALRVYTETRRVLLEELGIDPSTALQSLEQAILRQDADLAGPTPPSRPGSRARERSIMVGVDDVADLDALVAIAEPLAATSPRVVILSQVLASSSGLESAQARLNRQRADLGSRGLAARSAAFTSRTPGVDLARLATELDIELLPTTALADSLAGGPFDGDLVQLLAAAPCDVALLIPHDGGSPRSLGQAVLVPFGGSDTDWAAVELGAWLAKANGVPLRLAGGVRRPRTGSPRLQPAALPRLARRTARAGRGCRAGAHRTRGGWRARGFQRCWSARRRALQPLAARGARRRPRQNRSRGGSPGTARPARGASRRARPSGGADPVLVVGPPLTLDPAAFRPKHRTVAGESVAARGHGITSREDLVLVPNASASRALPRNLGMPRRDQGISAHQRGAGAATAPASASD